MRMYAWVMSVIAIVSTAANIGFGHYLYEFEQLNRQLQTQVVSMQHGLSESEQQIHTLDTALRVNRAYVRHLSQQLHDQSLVIARQLATPATHNVPWCSRQLQGEYTHTHTTAQQVGRRIQTLYARLYNASIDDMTYTHTWPHTLRVAVAVTPSAATPPHTAHVTLSSRSAGAARAPHDVRIVVTTRCVYVITP